MPHQVENLIPKQKSTQNKRARFVYLCWYGYTQNKVRKEDTLPGFDEMVWKPKRWEEKVFDDIPIYFLDAAAVSLTVCSLVPEKNLKWKLAMQRNWLI